MAKTAKKAMGRPKGRKPLLNLRIEQDLLDQLKAAGEEQDRTVAEETVRRLRLTFSDQEMWGDERTYAVMKSFAAVINALPTRGGAHWLDDPNTFNSARQAIYTVLDFVDPGQVGKKQIAKIEGAEEASQIAVNFMRSIKDASNASSDERGRLLANLKSDLGSKVLSRSLSNSELGSLYQLLLKAERAEKGGSK